MAWTITVWPSTSSMSQWTWTAERYDGETSYMGSASTKEEALKAARLAAAKVEAEQKVIEDNKVVEEYTPTDEDIVQIGFESP